MTGTYAAEISRTTPACVVILLDQSGSMADQAADAGGMSKASAAAAAVNWLIAALGRTSTKGVGQGARPYFDVAVLSYAGGRVTPSLRGASPGSELISIRELAANPVRVDSQTVTKPDGQGGQVKTTIKRQVWLDPKSEGGTPMREAMQTAREVIKRWADQHQNSYPPIVVNITDGKPNDDPTAAARALGEIRTADGSALLYNVHLSHKEGRPTVFPATPDGLIDKFARLLFDISSPLPDKIRANLSSRRYSAPPSARGFIFNADPALLVDFLEVGTQLDERDDRNR